jgi:hypothetical protein
MEKSENAHRQPDSAAFLLSSSLVTNSTCSVSPAMIMSLDPSERGFFVRVYELKEIEGGGWMAG